MLSIARETPDQDEVEHLLRKADERASYLYPTENRHGPKIATLVDQGVCFFVARINDIAIGCGGYIPSGDGAGELKRMFVETSARGQGVGRALLQAIEAEARRNGIRRMQSETGIKSDEARGLYGRFGYSECGSFGEYGPDPLSVFMEKDLTAS